LYRDARATIVGAAAPTKDADMNTDVAILPPTCRTCSAPITADMRFCEKCGAAQHEGLVEPRAKVQAALDRLSATAHRKQISNARSSILIVAIITLIFTVYQHVVFNNSIKAARANPSLHVIEAAVTKNTMVFFANYLIVTIFIAMFFWAKRNPFAACLTCLIIFVSNIIVNGAIDPTTIIQGFIMKFIVIFALLNGVKSGLAYRRMDDKATLD
jgi:hypothetical protein